MTSLQQLNIESFKEGNRLEAKLAKGGVPASLWETYASFANTDGGLILLGVKENKNHTFAIEGIDNPELMEKAFWDGVNNKRVVNINLLNNSDVEIKEVDGKTIIAIHVPRAERIYRPVYKGQDMFTGTYRRNGEGDYLCSREEVAAIFRDASQVTQDNKLMFSMIDIGERAGSGVPGVFSVWHKTFGASPEYSQRTSPDRITTTLFTTQKTTFTTQKTTQEPDNTEEKNGAKVIENTSEVIENVIENTSDVIENAVSLSKNQEAILRIIKDNPSISKAKLALEVGISENSISRNIEAMRGKYLRRVGPDKGGHWEVI